MLNALQDVIREWRAKGTEIDGCWVRRIPDIDQELNHWLQGQLKPADKVWTVWGYYLPVDIYYQQAVDDPFGVIAEWRQRLEPYPPSLKQAVLDRHLGSLRYWRNDYHYANKVKRKDPVFLAGLSARLVHDLVQVVFALNNAHFIGDGSNLEFIRRFPLQPEGFAARVRSALYPPAAQDMYERQREVLIGLIDDLARLAEPSEG